MAIISQDAIKLGYSGGQGKKVQVIRITGNQMTEVRAASVSKRVFIRLSDDQVIR